MAVLAAGNSRRFGEDDKLAAHFRGKRLGEHVCDNVPCDLFPPACCYVIASHFGHPCEPAWLRAGFGVSINDRAQEGIGTSVAAAMMLAAKAECDALMIALADMPFVPRKHFADLVRKGVDGDEVLCSGDGQVRMPPAFLPSKQLWSLDRLTGDVGARALLKDGRVVECPPEWLIDIDTPEALQKYGQA